MKFLLLAIVTIFLANSTPANAGSKEELKETIKQILKENPEIVMDVLKEEKATLFRFVVEGSEEAKQEETQSKLQYDIDHPKKPSISSSKPIRGNENAPITIVEYSDFQCPYCARGAEIVNKVLAKYKGKVRLIYKHFPLSFHNNAKSAAIWFEAIARQSKKKAWLFHDKMFEHQSEISQGDKIFYKVAKELKLNIKKLEKDIKDPKIIAIVEDDQAEGMRLGVQGTPHYLINGVAISGAAPVVSFDSVIQKILKEK